jgi:hypothetical protein
MAAVLAYCTASRRERHAWKIEAPHGDGTGAFVFSCFSWLRKVHFCRQDSLEA